MYSRLVNLRPRELVVLWSQCMGTVQKVVKGYLKFLVGELIRICRLAAWLFGWFPLASPVTTVKEASIPPPPPPPSTGVVVEVSGVGEGLGGIWVDIAAVLVVKVAEVMVEVFSVTQRSLLRRLCFSRLLCLCFSLLRCFPD
ncbi:hypothetical protein E2C01_049868 [Portunus trituberculatus]|uniref:Uncharacterized protein n=1 Tax=Portunus trituberculatus TaxID=210409 RepID=A0A5B7GAL5_PORTR|nr:hypothetical protein [Portunus trituberculatus]